VKGDGVPDWSLAPILTKLLFGSEAEEPLERTIEKLLTDQYQQRVNGTEIGRRDFADHVRAVRSGVAGGRLDVLEELTEGNRIAGRYLFHVVAPSGAEEAYEAHIFAERATDGGLTHMIEVNRRFDPDTDPYPARAR
jgi:hypothetical protein